MPSVSNVKRLPMELQNVIHTLFEKGHTITEVTDWLHQQGEEISRSSVGRYRMQWQEAVKDIQEARAFARMTMRDLADAEEDKIMSFNTQLLETSLMRVLIAVNKIEKESPEKAVALLEKIAKSHKYISSANKDNVVTTIVANDYSNDILANESLVSENKSIRVEIIAPKEKLPPSNLRPPLLSPLEREA